MKITLLCTECSDALHNRETQAIPLFATPLGDTPAYDVTCPQGHSVKQLLQNPKFELLFESGILALEDGYYREAVSSFAAALERFYEFLIQTLFVHNDPPSLLESFASTWKVLSKQSERQLGAFYMLYLLQFGSAAPILDSKFAKSLGLNFGLEGSDPVAFRNVVIHQGYVPKREQAVAYGEVVTDICTCY